MNRPTPIATLLEPAQTLELSRRDALRLVDD